MWRELSQLPSSAWDRLINLIFLLVMSVRFDTWSSPTIAFQNHLMSWSIFWRQIIVKKSPGPQKGPSKISFVSCFTSREKKLFFPHGISHVSAEFIHLSPLSFYSCFSDFPRFIFCMAISSKTSRFFLSEEKRDLFVNSRARENSLAQTWEHTQFLTYKIFSLTARTFFL